MMTAVLLLLAKTDLRVWHLDGQTFLVWKLGAAPETTTFDVYRSDEPITSLDSAQWVGRVLASNGENRSLWDRLPGARWVLPDGSGGYRLAPDEAYFVYTPHEAGDFYYTVVRAGADSPGPTVGPIHEEPSPPTAHLQYEDDTLAIWAHWVDGLAGTPDYPQMANRWYNGAGFNMVVWKLGGGVPAGSPLVVYLHGGDGSPLDSSLAGVPGGVLLSLDDRLPWVWDTSILAYRTFWFGYQDSLSPFEFRLLPPSGTTVRAYTARRVLWEID